MGSGDWDTSKDYNVATNAAGGGTRRDTDTAYDTVGTGGEGTSSGAATHYETEHAATDAEGSAATTAGSSTSPQSVSAEVEHRLSASDTSTVSQARLGRPREISREDVRRFVEAGAQLVDVLPREEYEEEHLAGAISIPLKELDAETTAGLRKDAPVIVYCHDLQ